MDFRGIAYLIVLAGAGAAALAAWKNWDTIKKSINPLDQDNLAATAANQVVSKLAGREETLGGWFRGLVSSDDSRIAAMLQGAKPPEKSADWREQLDAASPYASGVIL